MTPDKLFDLIAEKARDDEYVHLEDVNMVLQDNLPPAEQAEPRIWSSMGISVAPEGRYVHRYIGDVPASKMDRNWRSAMMLEVCQEKGIDYEFFGPLPTKPREEG